MPKPVFHVQNNPADVANAAATAIIAAAAESIRTRSRFSIALSGGSTPKDVYAVLAASPRDAIDWKRVHVWWSDERCVPWNHKDSNAGLAMDALVARVPIPSENVHRVPTQLPPVAAAEAYARELATFNAKKPLDLILLGIGADGHTASLFPGSPSLHEAEKWVVATTAPPTFPIKDRVTFTLPLLRTSRLLFLAVGEQKRDVITQIRTPSKHLHLPAQAACEVADSEWFIDVAANGTS